MTTQEIVSKLWNLCNVLRDDGITYHQYVTELTYILFLKMAKETGIEDTFSTGVELTDTSRLSGKEKETAEAENASKQIILGYSWDVLKQKSGIDLYNYYKDLLRVFGTYCWGRVQEIYSGSMTNIDEPKNLEKIITTIDGLDWYSAKEEGLGNLYEGLLEKNAGEKKSGAGQYFTPRVLIDVMTRMIKPQPGERCNDPACGTFGFMIAAHQYVSDHTDNFFDLDADTAAFERGEAFTGCELVHDTHRLALMNAMLHDMDGKITLGDTLSTVGQSMKNFDVVLTNPPFGTKKGGERATRDDFTFPTSNKQLNFLQHIYRSLKADGKARAAVVLPDNVKNNTKEVFFYDLRTNMPSFGKTHPLKKENFAGFEAAYTAKDRHTVKDERWSCFSRAEIQEKGNSLDLGLIKDDSIVDYDDLPDPIESGDQAIADLEEAASLLRSVVEELKSLTPEEA